MVNICETFFYKTINDEDEENGKMHLVQPAITGPRSLSFDILDIYIRNRSVSLSETDLHLKRANTIRRVTDNKGRFEFGFFFLTFLSFRLEQLQGAALENRVCDSHLNLAWGFKKRTCNPTGTLTPVLPNREMLLDPLPSVKFSNLVYR